MNIFECDILTQFHDILVFALFMFMVDKCDKYT